MRDYLLERISGENLNHVQALYRAVYAKNMSMEFLRGKYNTKIFGVAWLGFLAMTHNGNPVAFYGLVPCHFRINGKSLLAAQAVDAMTHISHQKNKLFMQLAEETHNIARAEGVQFIFGFPNQNSYTGLVKLGWKFTQRPMQLFVLKGSRFPIAKFFLRIPIFKALYQRILKTYFKSPDEVFDRSSRNGVIRDELFIEYKNQYTNTFVKKWGNVSAWMKNDGVLKIGLLQLDPAVSANTVINNLQETAKTLGCKMILLMTSSNSELYKTLARITSSIDGLPIGFYILANRHIDFEQVEFDYCDIDIF